MNTKEETPPLFGATINIPSYSENIIEGIPK
jgi:hypothetical protein